MGVCRNRLRSERNETKEQISRVAGDTPGDTPGGGGTGGYGDDDEPMDIEFDDHGWWFPDMPSFPGRS